MMNAVRFVFMALRYVRGTQLKHIFHAQPQCAEVLLALALAARPEVQGCTDFARVQQRLLFVCQFARSRGLALCACVVSLFVVLLFALSVSSCRCGCRSAFGARLCCCELGRCWL